MPKYFSLSSIQSGSQNDYSHKKEWICVNFQDLNQASLKYNYFLPNMESLLQQVTGPKLMSMLDGFSCDNQVLMKKEF